MSNWQLTAPFTTSSPSTLMMAQPSKSRLRSEIAKWLGTSLTAVAATQSGTNVKIKPVSTTRSRCWRQLALEKQTHGSSLTQSGELSSGSTTRKLTTAPTSTSTLWHGRKPCGKTSGLSLLRPNGIWPLVGGQKLTLLSSSPTFTIIVVKATRIRTSQALVIPKLPLLWTLLKASLSKLLPSKTIRLLIHSMLHTSSMDQHSKQVHVPTIAKKIGVDLILKTVVKVGTNARQQHNRLQSRCKRRLASASGTNGTLRARKLSLSSILTTRRPTSPFSSTLTKWYGLRASR